MRPVVWCAVAAIGVAGSAIAEAPDVHLAASTKSYDLAIASVLPTQGEVVGVAHPVVVTFGAPVVLLGFGLPGENAHAPNEWMSLENFAKGTEAVARLYDEMVRA